MRLCRWQREKSIIKVDLNSNKNVFSTLCRYRGIYAKARYRGALDLGSTEGSTKAITADRRTSTPYRGISWHFEGQSCFHWWHCRIDSVIISMVVKSWVSQLLSYRYSSISAFAFCGWLGVHGDRRSTLSSGRDHGHHPLHHRLMDRQLPHWGY